MAAKQKAGPAKGGAKKRSSASTTSSTTKKSKKPNPAAAAAKQHKPAPRAAPQKQKPKKRVYSDKELGIPKLNGIVPAGVQKQARAKKGKRFVEDRDQMDMIMKIVMAEKEGNIESKMMRARQMEEIREARRLEQERRAEGKRDGLEERKRLIKESKKKNRPSKASTEEGLASNDSKSVKKSGKRVSFG